MTAFWDRTPSGVRLKINAGAYSPLDNLTSNRRSTWELNGPLICDMLFLTASPPLTVLSLMTYRTPPRRRREPPPRSPRPPIEAFGLPPHVSGRPSDLVHRRIGEHRLY